MNRHPADGPLMRALHQAYTRLHAGENLGPTYLMAAPATARIFAPEPKPDSASQGTEPEKEASNERAPAN